MAMLEIGEVLISDSREGGQDYLLRPSFEAMSRIGEPDEIVKAFAVVHGSDVGQLVSAFSRLRCGLPSWITPSFYRMSETLLSTAMSVVQACCTEDLTPMIGEWKGWRRDVVYRPGQMPRNDIIVMAQHLMQHGIVGKAKVRRLQRHEKGQTTSEFRAYDYISAARSHFGISREEAATLTMTEFQLLLAQKYPDQKGFTREEYDQVADAYLAKQAARRARAKTNT